MNETEIIRCIQTNSLEDLKSLLDKNPNTDLNFIFYNDDSFTALIYATIYAAKYKDTKILELLLEHGADVNIQNKHGDTALIEASYNGHIETTKLLLEYKADPNLKDKDERTALMEASAKGHEEITKLLLQHGANLNIQDKKNGRTALMEASYRGNIPIIKLLLENGADISIPNKFHNTASFYAKSKNIRKFVLPLTSITLLGYEDVIEFYIQKNLYTHQKRADGKTPLLIAIEEGHLNIAELLINADKPDNDLKYADEYGLALTTALYYNHINIAELLIKHNKHLNFFIQHNSGWDPLMAACYIGNQEIASMLLEKYQQNPEITICNNNYGSNALILAAYAGHTHIVPLLLKSKLFDINQKNIFGTTPLIAAIYSGKNYIVNELLLNENLKLNPSSISELFLISIACLYSIFVHQNFSIPSMVFDRLYQEQLRNKKGISPSNSTSDNIFTSSLIFSKETLETDEKGIELTKTKMKNKK